MNSWLGKIHNPARLRWALAGFVVALGVPALILVYYSLSELNSEAFHRQRTLAIELSERINFQLNHWVELEEQRRSDDYQFLVVSGDPTANYFQLSPLSALSVSESMPGSVGYFQLDANKQYSSPLLPSTYLDATKHGISADEYRQRESLKEQMRQILLDSRWMRPQTPISATEIAQASGDLDEIETREENEADSREADSTETDSTETDSYAESSRQRRADNYRRIPERSDNDDNNVALANIPIRVSDAQKYEVQLHDQSRDANGYGSQNNNELTKNIGNSDAIDQLKERRLVLEKDIENKLQTVTQEKMSAPAASPPSTPRTARKEQTLLPQIRQGLSSTTAASGIASSGNTPIITMFESEVDPFEFRMLDSGYWVFSRNVWREGERATQGLVISQQQFLRRTIAQEYRNTLLSDSTDLIVSYAGNPIAAYRSDMDYGSEFPNALLAGELLFQSRLVAPFNQIELLYSVNQLPDGPGALVVKWSAVVMVLVLAIGTALLYRLGLRQMRLAQQQQDFVSAVSHELKTPLTSIRMYGEMLRQGWADEQKKRQYYDFIYDESERLSRLIANVLQLARMNRRELELQVKPVSVGELVDLLRSKISGQIERAGFDFNLNCDTNLKDTMLLVDVDAFTQVMINLVDNAIKFSAKSDHKSISLTLGQSNAGEFCFALRDHGPGIDKPHLSKIFRLFYRAENELTRETVGTGIGLALVHQLVQGMQGRIEVSNKDPGAEFRVFVQITELVDR